MGSPTVKSGKVAQVPFLLLSQVHFTFCIFPQHRTATRVWGGTTNASYVLSLFSGRPVVNAALDNYMLNLGPVNVICYRQIRHNDRVNDQAKLLHDCEFSA